MDQLKSRISSSSPDQSNTTETQGRGPGEQNNPSTGDLMSSAQMLKKAAVSKMPEGPEKKKSEEEEVNMGKLAGAGGDLLGAARRYGKLDQGAYGQYIQKAEGFLENYEQKNKTGGNGAPSSYESQETGRNNDDHYGKHSSSADTGDEQGNQFGK
eukprot:Gb_15065 [translate_table: standard]